MCDLKTSLVCATALLAVVARVNAGALTGINELVNGGFDADAQGTNQPAGWDSFFAQAEFTWDGVVAPGSMGGGHPAVSPAGGNCYGDSDVDGFDPWGQIDQDIDNPDTGLLKEIWVGGWIYTADGPGAFVRFHIEQAATGLSWDSDPIWEPVGGGAGWTWHEFLIPADYGFECYDFNFRVDIQLAQGVNVGIHGMFVDGLEVETRCIPEPTSLGLIGLGMLPLWGRRKPQATA